MFPANWGWASSLKMQLTKNMFAIFCTQGCLMFLNPSWCEKLVQYSDHKGLIFNMNQLQWGLNSLLDSYVIQMFSMWISNVQWGLKYQTSLLLRWAIVVWLSPTILNQNIQKGRFSLVCFYICTYKTTQAKAAIQNGWNQPFEIGTFQNGCFSLGHFIYKDIKIYFHIFL